MLKRIFKNEGDLYSGLMFAAISVAGMLMLQDLEIGTADRMGPGYFPLAISLLLMALSLFLIAKSAFGSEETVESIQLRPLLLVMLSLIVFALLISRTGLILAIMALVVVATFAAPREKFLQSMIFGFVLAILSGMLFVWVLRVPIKLLP